MQSSPKRSPGSTLMGTVNVNDWPNTASETARPKPSAQTCWDANAVAAKMTCAVKCFFILWTPQITPIDSNTVAYRNCRRNTGREWCLFVTYGSTHNSPNISGFANFCIHPEGRQC